MHNFNVWQDTFGLGEVGKLLQIINNKRGEEAVHGLSRARQYYNVNKKKPNLISNTNLPVYCCSFECKRSSVV